jgi:hypothetical protein
MGGFGSGRKWGKTTTDEMWRLDVRCLARGGHLKPGNAFRWQWQSNGVTIASINLTVQVDLVWLQYKQRERGREWEDMCYPVSFDWTACHMGGKRVWWQCPVVSCGRRVAVLYGGWMYACRHCYRMAYRCQREVHYDRAARRADTLRERLGWSEGPLSGSGDKPKGMRWSTFDRLCEEHNDHVNRALAGVARRFGMFV